jgi:uncharacterized protein YndB with AHSA1/START domain
MELASVSQPVVVQEVAVEAPPETVFAYFVEPDRMTRWMGSEAELDARPGGVYRVAVNATHVARGEYVEVDPPRRVVFTWGWEHPDAEVPAGASTVVVTLAAEGAGTRVRLEHRDLPEAARESHGHGWEHYLPRLAVAAAGGDAGVDPWSER